MDGSLRQVSHLASVPAMLFKEALQVGVRLAGEFLAASTLHIRGAKRNHKGDGGTNFPWLWKKFEYLWCSVFGMLPLIPYVLLFQTVLSAILAFYEAVTFFSNVQPPK